MAGKLEKLKEVSRVYHRSKDRISKKDASIQLDDTDPNDPFIKVDIGEAHKAEDRSKESDIKIADVEGVKVKDFNDGGHEIHIVSVNHRDGKHTSFQFEKRDDRDHWFQGLQQLQSGVVANARTQVKVPAGQYMSIKAIALQKPGPGQLVFIKIDLAEGKQKQVDLVVPTDKTSRDACKHITDEFVEANLVLPTEKTSLYRYIRSVVQRAQMEKEVEVIVEEINSQSFEKLKSERSGESPSDDQLLEQTKGKLTEIANSIPQRIGQHGSGATIVTQILKRNVDKMKLINDMVARLAQGDGGAAPPGNGQPADAQEAKPEPAAAQHGDEHAAG